MARLERPLVFRTLRTTGDVLLCAELVLSLKTSPGGWKKDLFLMDSGTEMTTIPASRAKRFDLLRLGWPGPGLGPRGARTRRSGADALENRPGRRLTPRIGRPTAGLELLEGPEGAHQRPLEEGLGAVALVRLDE